MDERKYLTRKEGEEVEPGAAAVKPNATNPLIVSKTGGRWMIVLVVLVSATLASYWLDPEKTLSVCHLVHTSQVQNLTYNSNSSSDGLA